MLTFVSSLLIGGLYNNATLQAEIVVAGSIDETTPEIIIRQFGLGIIDLHKALCQTANENKQKGKN
ncbi:MAG: hypothetical protein LBC30_00790, partial [Puniceicoccales bacterium]|nr:hypothetical protein [Puniceicoccales bacterium]